MKTALTIRNTSFFILFGLIPILIIKYGFNALALTKFLSFSKDNIVRLIFFGFLIVFVISSMIFEGKKNQYVKKFPYKKFFIIIDAIIICLLIIWTIICLFVLNEDNTNLIELMRLHVLYHYVYGFLGGIILGTFFYQIIINR